MINLAKKYYPHMDDEELGDLLMEATCFPFGSPEQVERNLIELVENTDGTLQGAIDFTYKQMKEAFENQIQCQFS